MEGNYTFAGVSEIEAQERVDEYPTGVPALGAGTLLLDAPGPSARQNLNRIHVRNPGGNAAHLRMRHGGSTKTVSNELLTALAVPATNRYVGRLAWDSLVAGSVTIKEAGALLNIVDDGEGVLHDVGDPTAVRGTINYTLGEVDFTWGGAATAPVQIDYQHDAFTDFVGPAQSENPSLPTGANPPTTGSPYVISPAWGRINPGSVALSFATGPLTFVDDGKGNIVETTAGQEAKRGTIDYGTGIITMTDASAILAGLVTLTYTFNPFAGVVNGGGGGKMFDMHSGQFPELTAQAWANGVKGEPRVGLWGECREASVTSHLVTKWFHFGEDPFRVRSPLAAFPAGGHSNDPSL